jgi:hypothetical protein
MLACEWMEESAVKWSAAAVVVIVVVVVVVVVRGL